MKIKESMVATGMSEFDPELDPGPEKNFSHCCKGPT